MVLGKCRFLLRLFKKSFIAYFCLKDSGLRPCAPSERVCIFIRSGSRKKGTDLFMSQRY